MPTGYTVDIAKGISFRQFALNCAKAFGALITMRDEPADAPIPEKFEPSDYHTRELQSASDRLARLKLMSAAEIAEAADKDHAAAVASNRDRILEMVELRKKYVAMLVQVEDWRPPTPDHENYKQFMIDQIRSSIIFDCDTTYYEKNVPMKLAPAQWIAKQIEGVEQSIAYHTAEQAEELKRVASRNAWVSALRDSLPDAT